MGREVPAAGDDAAQLPPEVTRPKGAAPNAILVSSGNVSSSRDTRMSLGLLLKQVSENKLSKDRFRRRMDF